MAQLPVNVSDVQALIGGGVSGPVPEKQFGLLAGYVSDLARTYCNQNFLSGTYKEQYRGNGGVALVLNQQPVKGVTLLSVNNCAIPACPQDANGAYLVNAKGFGFGATEIFLYGGYRFERSDRPNVFVNYAAGYASISALPQDLYWALVQEAAWVYLELKRLGKDMVRFADAGSESFKVVPMSPRCRLTLDHYKTWSLNT